MVDMDDVVADWIEHAANLLNRRIEKGGIMVPEDEWARLKTDQHFYRHLPIRKGGQELMDWLTWYVENSTAEHQLGFLTAIPRKNDMPWAPYDKMLWAQERFPGIPVFLGPYSHEKYMHCVPGDILIDDRVDNCTDWESAGGIAHIYKEWPECHEWLCHTLNVMI